jgi:hypothetical protein
MIASLQATWFLTNCIIRAVQHLFLITLKITRLSIIIIIIVLFTLFFWSHKHQDISRAIILHTNTPIGTILHAPKRNTVKHRSNFFPAMDGSTVACGATTFKSYTIYIFQFSPDQALSLTIAYPPIASCVLIELRRLLLFLACYYLLVYSY